MTVLTHSQSLQLIRDRLQEGGDMPIFSATVNRVQMVGSDPDADAMALSVEILKDANLTTKVLKLANSPMFNRGLGKIGNLSRAVVVLGFDTVKSVVLTLKLIDGFQQQFPGIDMTGMLVNSFLTAGFARGVSARCGIKDIEQVYICGLLHNLGEIVAAYTLPDKFREIQALRREQGLSQAEAEKQILGTTLRTLGQDIARDWEFPQTVVNTMEDRASEKGVRIRNQTELVGALSSLSSKTMSLLYAETPDTNKSLAELTFEMSKVAGIRKEDVSNALEQSFKQSCEMAQAYGLNKKHLTPKLRGGDDEALDKLARQFSFYANSEISNGVAETAPTATEAAPKAAQPAAASAPAAGGDANLLLSILFEITTLMTQKATINAILDKVLEGLHRGIGFDRAVLCLLNPDHSAYAGRLAAGEGADELKAYLSFPVNVQRDLFSKVIMEGNELLVSDIDQGGWRQQLPADFEQQTGARSFLLGTLRSKNRPLGMFYVDKARSGTPISPEEHRSFTQLVAQAQLALQMR
jgi:HD-like signal output (HDOD) protein